MSHRIRITLGVLLTTVGLVGALALGPAFTVAAQPADPATEGHELMEDMMDAMHGPGTADRMHRMPGAEKMMDQCSAMMEDMDGGMMSGGMMNGMMSGGMMNGMMNGGMMSGGMMNGMMGSGG